MKKFIGIALVIILIIAIAYSMNTIEKNKTPNSVTEQSVDSDITNILNKIEEDNSNIKDNNTIQSENNIPEENIQEENIPEENTQNESNSTDYVFNEPNKEVDDTNNDIEVNTNPEDYYENIKSESEVEYNIMKPTGGYDKIELQNSELNSVDMFETHFNEIFGSLFIDDEYIMSISRDEVVLKTDTFNSNENTTTINFEYSKFAGTDMTVTINKSSRHIEYNVNF